MQMEKARTSDVLTSLVVLLVFVVCGPPLGVLIGAGLVLVATVTEQGVGAFRSVPTSSTILHLLQSMKFSYVVGGIQAFLVGMVAFVAYGNWDIRRLSFLRILLFVPTALVVVFHVMIGSFELKSSSIILGVHLAATTGCWLIVRTLVGLGEPPLRFHRRIDKSPTS